VRPGYAFGVHLFKFFKFKNLNGKSISRSLLFLFKIFRQCCVWAIRLKLEKSSGMYFQDKILYLLFLVISSSYAISGKFYAKKKFNYQLKTLSILLKNNH